MTESEALFQKHQDILRRIVPASMVRYRGGRMSITREGTQFLANAMLHAVKEIIAGRLDGDVDKAMELKPMILKRLPLL